MHAVLLRALESHARSAHLRHAEGVVGLDAQHLLDAAAGVLAVRLGADDQRPQFRVPARVDALLAHHLIQPAGVGRDGVHHGRAEIREELQLTERVARCRRDGQHPELLGPVLEAQAAGKHPVSGRVLEHVVRPAAHHPQAARHGLRPLVQVPRRMQDDRRVARRPAGRMQAHALLQRHGRDPKRIRVPQVLLGREGKLIQVSRRADVIRRQAAFGETLLVKRRIHAVPHGRTQALGLQGLDPAAGQSLHLRMEEGSVAHSSISIPGYR